MGKPVDNSAPEAKVDREIERPPKLERPQSLSLQQSEDVETADDKAKSGDDDGDAPKLPVEVADVGDLENGVKEVAITDHPKEDDKDEVKKTPSHLTEQGFFDLKFYHNKLW